MTPRRRIFSRISLSLVVAVLTPATGHGQYLQAVIASKPTSNLCEQVPGMAKCKGHPIPEWVTRSTVASQRALAEWIATVESSLANPAPNEFVERPAGGGTRWLAIQTIPETERAWVGDLSNETTPMARGLVVARLTAWRVPSTGQMEPGPVDDRYGVGPQAGAEFLNQFYIVAFDFDATDQLLAHDSYRVSQWRMFGVRVVRNPAGEIVERRFVQLPSMKTGYFRLCKKPHPRASGVVPPAQFTECLPAHQYLGLLDSMPRLREAIGPRSLLSAIVPYIAAEPGQVRDSLTLRRMTPNQLDRALRTFVDTNRIVLRTPQYTIMRRMLVLARVAPGWMPCGVGCCTADG